MNRDQVRRSMRKYGIRKTFQDLCLRAVNRAVLLRIVKGIKIEKVNPDFLQCGERYTCRFLGRAELREFSIPDYELSVQFIDAAVEKGDECCAILDGRRLAAYGWYSSRPTDIGLPAGLRVHFDPAYKFMYKGFTHEAYRGQRLHAVGMTHALAAYLERGYRGLISDVKWNNFASLDSCYRMGYEDFGTAFVLGFGDFYLVRSSAGCRQHAFGLQRETAPEKSALRS